MRDGQQHEVKEKRPSPAKAAGLRPGRWLAGAAVALALLVMSGLVAWRSGARVEELAALGYPGVFLVMVISGASVLFPVPGQAAILAAGALWNPILVGLAAGLGNATGEFTGYLAGRAGAAMLKGHQPTRWWWLLHTWMERHGFLTILALALVPNPVFDALGLLAGSLHFPPRRFWLACALGNTVKYTAMAHLGEAALWALR